ncbi:MAG: hypothetical protein N2318_04945 [Meiothermus sp.]|nr:hypothetical protein [Meiothermus sp.]
MKVILGAELMANAAPLKPPSNTASRASFLLCFWPQGEARRIRLEPLSGSSEGRYFSNLESLLAFLESAMQADPRSPTRT